MLSEEDRRKRMDLAKLLAQLSATEPLGTELHGQIVRLAACCVAVEAVAVRLSPGTIRKEVFLRRRADDEPSYPGEWHAPGTFPRGGDTMETVFRRLSEKEFGAPVTGFQLVDASLWQEERGQICSNVYLVEVDAVDSETRRWFPLDALPEKMVWHHRDHIIPAAAAAFPLRR